MPLPLHLRFQICAYPSLQPISKNTSLQVRTHLVIYHLFRLVILLEHRKQLDNIRILSNRHHSSHARRARTHLLRELFPGTIKTQHECPVLVHRGDVRRERRRFRFRLALECDWGAYQDRRLDDTVLKDQRVGIDGYTSRCVRNWKAWLGQVVQACRRRLHPRCKQLTHLGTPPHAMFIYERGIGIPVSQLDNHRPKARTAWLSRSPTLTASPTPSHSSRAAVTSCGTQSICKMTSSGDGWTPSPICHGYAVQTIAISRIKHSPEAMGWSNGRSESDGLHRGLRHVTLILPPPRSYFKLWCCVGLDRA
jgi:hypothetical protein